MNNNTKIIVTVFSGILFIGIVGVVLVGSLAYLYRPAPRPIIPTPTIAPSSSTFEIKKFESPDKFKEYLINSNSSGGMGGFGGVDMGMRESMKNDVNTGIPAPIVANPEFQQSSPTDRYSETNVQIKGIDEPDIVKTDGQNLYLSSEEWLYYPMMDSPAILRKETVQDDLITGQAQEMPMAPDTINSKLMMPIEPYPTPIPQKTNVVSAIPVETMEILKRINFNGDLLLNKDTLIIINSTLGIEAYNISDKTNPTKIWDIKYQENFYYTNARLSNGKFFLVLNSYVYQDTPCPISPLLENGTKYSIDCTEIYYPTHGNSSNVTNILKIDPTTGKIENTLNYMGDQYQNIFYMSEENIYLTFPTTINEYDFIIGFVKAKGLEIMSQADIDRILKIDSYDISSSSKLNEIQNILNKYQYNNGVENKDAMNAVMAYYESIKREIEQTNIVKISQTNLEIGANGKVPGNPLNQFSLDEYKNNLRISTTIGNNWLLGISNDKSTNDVYILDENLNIIGSALDMGKGERIYSTRFMGDTAYLVTFRQTDPFYVLDLSNPSAPKIAGELKIPGYSSYLHELEENLVLGVGMDNNNVKLSLFDVTNSSNPIETDKFQLKNSYWSEVESNHHAFLQDSKHKIFFIPAEGKGYIFSYKDNKITLVKEVSNINAKRALYINDFLYIIGNDKIVVLNELTWEELKTLKIN